MSNTSKSKTKTKTKTKPKKIYYTKIYDHAGRPPLPPKKRRNKKLSIRFTADELKEIEVAAHDRMVAEAAREILLDSARRNKFRIKKSA
jgi:hypothetical protein